jgi:hypothetical protein
MATAGFGRPGRARDGGALLARMRGLSIALTVDPPVGRPPGNAACPFSDLKGVTLLAESPLVARDTLLETTLNDRMGIISAGMEIAPAAGIVLLAALAAWLLWRMARRALRAFGDRSQAPRDHVHRARAFERREPILEPATARNPPPATVSEILALRASIDALTRQVAELSGKLAAPEEAGLHAANRPSPLAVSHGDRAISVERRGPRAVSLSR